MTENLSSVVEWHDVELPSRGLWYEACPGGQVAITPWTMAQEAELVQHSSKSKVSLIDKLVMNNTRLPPGMKYDDLLVTDQHFLLMRLRQISLASSYTLDRLCPVCKRTEELTLDLAALQVRFAEPGDEEPWEVFLPRCGKTVGMRPLRIRDQQAISDYQAKVDGQPGAPGVRFRLARQIATIDGSSAKIDEKTDFLNTLVLIDIEIMRDIVNEKASGILTETKVVCSRCESEAAFDIPIDVSFFRPKRADLRAASDLAKQARGTHELPRE